MEGQVLGDYQILKQIGRGSLGEVLLAEHRFIKKQYVLKVLPEELTSDRGFIQRFEEEVVKLSQLEHPHIVKIHNVSFAEGVYFVVTDCIVDSIGETTNLAQYMSGRKERFREEELVNLLTQVADALDYAHGKDGVVHQTLKLNNILVGKGKPGIEVFISDFGLSKIIGPPAVVSRSFKAMAETLEIGFGLQEKYASVPVETHKLSKLTLSFLQNYAFLAPEQKRLETSDLPIDTYAFGILTYYLITGYFPEGILEMPSEVAPEYQHDWDRLVTDCLQLNPKKRPRQLRAILQQIAKGSLSRSQPFFHTPPAFRPPQEERVEKEKPSLPRPLPAPEQPLPQKQALSSLEQEEPVLAAAAPIKVEKAEIKSADSATPPAITPSKDEQYEQALSSMLNREPVVTQYHPEEKEKKPIEPLLTDMIIIPTGLYMRGSNGGSRDEMPQHQIQVEGFALDIHPVANEQFVRFLEYMGGEKDQNYHDLIRLKDARINRTGGRLSIESGYAKHPVVGVTWYGAVAYAKWVGKRLPTEAEWEIACRGGIENTLYPTGETIEKTQANFFSSDTTPVMSYAPNGYGLYDMVGNVYEWCQDWYGYNYFETSAQEPHNPTGPIQGVYRVLRGGCWKSLKEDLRCTHRHRNNPGTVNGTYGFRCAASV